MKLQEVILKAMAKKLSWIEAAEIAGMSVRNMQRMRDRYGEHGYNGLFDQRRGNPATLELRRMQMVAVETSQEQTMDGDPYGKEPTIVLTLDRAEVGRLLRGGAG